MIFSSPKQYTTSLLFVGKRFFPGTKRSGRDIDLSPPSSVRDMLTFTSVYCNPCN